MSRTLAEAVQVISAMVYGLADSGDASAMAYQGDWGSLRWALEKADCRAGLFVDPQVWQQYASDWDGTLAAIRGLAEATGREQEAAFAVVYEECEQQVHRLFIEAIL